MSERYEKYVALIAKASKLDMGYNQRERFSFLDKLGKRLLDHKEADCSALSMGLAWLAGYPIAIEGLCFTGNAYQVMGAAQWTIKSVEGMSLAQINKVAFPGVMIVGPGHMMTYAGNDWWLSANQDEFGNIAGGKAGDQTGAEVNLRRLWDRRGGWHYLIIPPDASSDKVCTPTVSRSLPVLMFGSRGAAVKSVQLGLLDKFGLYASNLAVDGVYGVRTVATVKEFQRRSGLTSDGVIGPKTWAALAKYGIHA